MKYVIATLLMLACSSVNAGMVKTAVPSSTGLRLMWWPKVSPPNGWHFDQGSSYYFSFNAMAPNGSTFSKAETVMYARADYKPRLPDIKTLQAFISNDMASFKQDEPTIVMVLEHPLRTKRGQSFQIALYHPAHGSSGNWERVAYGEDGEYYLTFVVSSRSNQGLKAAMPAFMSLLSSYQPGP